MEKIANPFDTNEEELITLDAREIMDPEIVNCLKKIEVFGKSLRDEAVAERIELDLVSTPLQTDHQQTSQRVITK